VHLPQTAGTNIVKHKVEAPSTEVSNISSTKVSNDEEKIVRIQTKIEIPKEQLKEPSNDSSNLPKESDHTVKTGDKLDVGVGIDSAKPCAKPISESSSSSGVIAALSSSNQLPKTEPKTPPEQPKAPVPSQESTESVKKESKVVTDSTEPPTASKSSASSSEKVVADPTKIGPTATTNDKTIIGTGTNDSSSAETKKPSPIKQEEGVASSLPRNTVADTTTTIPVESQAKKSTGT